MNALGRDYMRRVTEVASARATRKLRTENERLRGDLADVIGNPRFWRGLVPDWIMQQILDGTYERGTSVWRNSQERPG